MRTRGEGVQKSENPADVIYGWSLRKDEGRKRNIERRGREISTAIHHNAAMEMLIWNVTTSRRQAAKEMVAM